MSVLVDFQDTIGGAPRSMLEHTKALSNLGHNVIGIISEKGVKDFFQSSNFKLVYLPPFRRYNLIKSLFILYKYYKLIKAEKINLIYANRVIQSQYLSLLSDFCKTPILNARAGGRIDSGFLVSIHKHKPYIVYSEENLEAFHKFGFMEKNLFLLKNRIPLPKLTQQDIKTNNDLVVTLTGNIKSDTLKGVIWFIEFIKKNAPKINHKCTINIAGKCILKSDEEIIRFQNTISQSGSFSQDKGYQINHLGWVDDIVKLQSQSDICIGKGRSICQPAMMGKIAFVISESGRIFRCKKDIYNDLTYYNFSGRGKVKEEIKSEEEFLNILHDSKLLTCYRREAEELSVKFREDYSTEFLQEKLGAVVDFVWKSYSSKNASRKAIIQLLKLMLRTTILWARKKIKR